MNPTRQSSKFRSDGDITMYKFSAASERERIVFGSACPGYSNQQVNEWIESFQDC
jgi:ATP/maltotriose-dependent transcriptional regulator MalT